MDHIEAQLVKAGLIGRVGGEIYYTPQGKKIKAFIENTLRTELDGINAEEAEFPTIVDYGQITMNPLIKRGRMSQCIEIELANDRKRCLVRTCEELAAEFFFNRKQIDGIIYQIKTKYRDEDAEQLCFTKRNEFTMLDVYSCEGREVYDQYAMVKKCFITVCKQIGVSIEFVKSNEGTDQGIFSEEIICTNTVLEGLELGHLYRFGTLYSSPFDLSCSTSSYGIGIDRLFAAYVLAGEYQKGGGGKWMSSE